MFSKTFFPLLTFVPLLYKEKVSKQCRPCPLNFGHSMSYHSGAPILRIQVSAMIDYQAEGSASSVDSSLMMTAFSSLNCSSSTNTEGLSYEI